MLTWENQQTIVTGRAIDILPASCRARNAGRNVEAWHCGSWGDVEWDIISIGMWILNKSILHGDRVSTIICKYLQILGHEKKRKRFVWRLSASAMTLAPWLASNRKQPTSSASAASALHMCRPLSFPTEWKSSTVASEVSGSVLNIGRTAEGSNLVESRIQRVQPQLQIIISHQR